MAIRDIHYAINDGDDTMSYDDMKKMYVCASMQLDDGRDVTVRFANTIGPEGITLACMVLPNPMTRLEKSSEQKYYLMSSIHDLLTSSLPPDALPPLNEFGIVIR